MKKLLSALLLFTAGQMSLQAQSFEIMPGHENVFADIQWLKPVVPGKYNATVFSRTRATVDYDNHSDLFSALYVNYTFQPGLGLTALGAIGNTNGFTPAAGAHYFLSKKTWTVFVLASVDLKKDGNYSLFSINRFQPALNEKWKLYFSLEIYSVVNKERHVVSLQRLRAGAERSHWQFGAALNLTEPGNADEIFTNLGPFLRKEF